MATDLYIISNIKTNKEEVLANKDIYLQKLKELNLEHITVIGVGKLTGDWKYELPLIYDEESDKLIPNKESLELIYFSSPFVFSVYVYENCLELSTIYKYRFLYEDEYRDLDFVKANLLEFRKNIFDIITIFGGTEIIYLADNGCNKLSNYLELWVWEGKSYFDVKQDMIDNKIPFRKDYQNLKLNDLSYNNIKEIIFDDFVDIKK
jgi:hypothetical protein